MKFKYLLIIGWHLLTLSCLGQVINTPKDFLKKNMFWDIMGKGSIGIVTSFNSKNCTYTWNVYNKKKHVVDNPMCSCVRDFSNDFSVNNDTLQFSYYRTRDIIDEFKYKLAEISDNRIVMKSIGHNEVLGDTITLMKSRNQNVKLHMSNESRECDGFSTYSEGMDKFYAHVEESIREVGFQQNNIGNNDDISMTFFIDRHGKIVIKDISYNPKHKREQKQFIKRLQQVLNTMGSWTEPVCPSSGKVVSKSVNYVIKVKI